MSMTVLPRTLLGAALALALAGCGDPAPADADAAATGAAAPAATADGEAAAPAGGAADAGPALDEPIAPIDIATRLALVGEPAHAVADDALVFEVQVRNDGGAALTSTGSKPVQLGVTLAGPDGVDKAPGVRDFQRVRLPLVPAGESRTVSVRVPVPPVLGLTLRLELVQETVAWFGQYQQPTLDLGPFQRCSDDAPALCDAEGKALPTR